MNIGKEYKVYSDNMNVILAKRRRRKRRDTGESYEDWQDIAYCATTAEALKYLLGEEVRATELKDLEAVVKRVGQVEAMIDKSLASESHTGQRKPAK